MKEPRNRANNSLFFLFCKTDNQDFPLWKILFNTKQSNARVNLKFKLGFYIEIACEWPYEMRWDIIVYDREIIISFMDEI